MPPPKASLRSSREANKAKGKRRKRHTGNAPCRPSSGREAAMKADRNIVLYALRCEAEASNSEEEACAEDMPDIAYIGEKAENTIDKYFKKVGMFLSLKYILKYNSSSNLCQFGFVGTNRYQGGGE